jgi:hypothetical protein
MATQRDAPTRDLFEELLQLPRGEREAAMQRLVPSGSGVEKRLRKLLAAAEEDEKSLLGGLMANPEMRAQWLASGRPPELEPGTQVAGGYRVVRKLGSGGLADVYLAIDETLGRLIALKVTSSGEGEPRILAKMSHPLIVQVYAVGRDETIGADVMALQYVPPGTTLKDVMDAGCFAETEAGRALGTLLEARSAGDDGEIARRRRTTELDGLSPRQLAASVTSDLLEALAFAHRNDILHLDVKPSNILINHDGRAVLSDFNVSVDEQKAEGPKGGTASYMAPEHEAAMLGQADHPKLDGRTDLYAVGKLAKEMLEQARDAEAAEIYRVVEQALAPAMDDRFADAAQMLEAVSRAEKWTQLRADLEAMGEAWKGHRWCARHTFTACFAAALVPSAAASMVQILYNKVHIVDATTPAQRELFLEIVGPWNAIVFMAAAAVLWIMYGGIFADLAREGRVRSRKALKRIIHNPRVGGWLTLGGWSMGCLLFIVALGGLDGSMGATLVRHFVLSFALVMGLSAAYAYLALAYLSATVLAPNAVDVLQPARGLTPKALSKLARGMKLARICSGVLPLIGAGVIVVEGPGLSVGGSDYPFQALVLAFMTLSCTGFVLANTMTERALVVLEAIRGAIEGHWDAARKLTTTTKSPRGART